MRISTIANGEVEYSRLVQVLRAVEGVIHYYDLIYGSLNNNNATIPAPGTPDRLSGRLAGQGLGAGLNMEVLMEEIVRTLKGVDNEATSAPYWLILDPSQNMRCNIHEMARGISGPFFCRNDAERYLKATRYNFSSRANVYCCSGHHSNKYERLCRSLRV